MKEKVFNISVAVLIAVALALTIFNYTNEDVLLEPPEMGMADRFGGVGAYPNYPAPVSSDSDADLGCSASLMDNPEYLKESSLYEAEGWGIGDYSGCPFRQGTWVLAREGGLKVMELEFGQKGALVGFTYYQSFTRPKGPDFRIFEFDGNRSESKYMISPPIPQNGIVKLDNLVSLVEEQVSSDGGSISMGVGRLGYRSPSFIALVDNWNYCYNGKIYYHGKFLDINQYSVDEKQPNSPTLRHGLNSFTPARKDDYFSQTCGDGLYDINYNYGKPT